MPYKLSMIQNHKPNSRKHVRILHIVECYSGGVRRALRSYVEATPDLEHVALISGEDQEHVRIDLPTAKTGIFKSSGMGRVSEIRSAVKESRPHVVHAHSSWAGMHARLALPRRTVLYQPHAFYFLNPSLSRVSAMVARGAEQFLARFPTHYLTLSAHEDSLVKGMHPGATSSRISNVPTLPEHYKDSWRPGYSSRVVMVGRVVPQKDPTFFAEVASGVRAKDASASFVWAGDGDASLKAHLERAGVLVTGWLGERRLAELLATSAVYFHSALYEGSPLSVLDAAHVGCPIVVRETDSTRDINAAKISTAAEGIEVILGILEEARFNASGPADCGLQMEVDASMLGNQLTQVYEEVSELSRVARG
ncbi:glycosyltransferase [Terrabacter sp. 2YAF2]|uniref:glycosyltransferase n=1 Tax=Terrabacter sp. 2YAF2 TaxID=3233026 RepID=UPI003F9CA541